jgi:hypothetical protein
MPGPKRKRERLHILNLGSYVVKKQKTEEEEAEKENV